MPESIRSDFSVYQALAKLHHQYFLGLQLMVSANESAGLVGDWMFHLFRQQHEDKFLSSFGKLGLQGLPHAVACARYHVLSNGVGGVPVEYMYESDRKAWVRFRYPRWMFAGPAICGVPVSASRGFLKGWYAHNGVSLGNPRLGFVCVSEDMTGEFGLCGYFKEYDHDLAPEARLRFAKEERPPVFIPDEQPQPPASDWSEERLAKANRNYAVEYVRNGVVQLCRVLPVERALALSRRAGRLIGLQYAAEISQDLGHEVTDAVSLAALMKWLFEGMGDQVDPVSGSESERFHHQNLRIVKGLEQQSRTVLLTAWCELFTGMGMAQQRMLKVIADLSGPGVDWQIHPEQLDPG